MYICHSCSCQEILRLETGLQVPVSARQPVEFNLFRCPFLVRVLLPSQRPLGLCFIAEINGA
jgi:hypothetical protein